MNESRIAEILKEFEIYDGVYKRAELDAALELQEQITPHLIAVLEGVLAEPSVYVAETDYFAHLYALILLAHFREPAAHRVIVDLFSLPSKIPDQLFGDLVTESLPGVLFRTCDGELELIKSLALNKEAHEYCRGSALEAMVLAVADGMIAREEALAFFGSLFTGDEAAPDSTFWDQLACCVNDLYPEELMDVIKQAYQVGLISQGFIYYEEFLHTLKSGQEHAFRELQDQLRRSSPNDVHQHMSSWGLFKQNEPAVSPSVPIAPTVAPTVAPSVAPSVPRSRSQASKSLPLPKSRKKAQKKKKGKKGKASKKKKRR